MIDYYPQASPAVEAKTMFRLIDRAGETAESVLKIIRASDEDVEILRQILPQLDFSLEQALDYRRKVEVEFLKILAKERDRGRKI